MTLTQIEQAANRGRIASGDFDLASSLRFEVVPEFYRKAGEGDPTWMKRNATLSLTAPTRQYNLPEDFRSMVVVYEGGRSAAAVPAPMKYIGEDPLLVAQAEITTAAGAPGGYYIVQRSSDSKWKAIKFDRPIDQAYTIPYVYLSRLVFGDDQDDVELDTYIPEELQQALIVGLRREIYFDRFGQGDSRYDRAAQKFDELCMMAQNFHDHARRNYAIYSR